jgi:beta-phosphoglucomutase-like phosphatase (HAD superfamily)
MPPATNQLPVPMAVVFDLDGTLVDTVETRIRAWLQVFEEFGFPASRPQIEKLIGIDGRQLAREVAGVAGVTLPEGGDEAIDRRCGEIYGELNRDPRPLPGARELLMWLDDVSLPWAIATSSRREQVGASVAALDLPREPTIVDGTHVAHAKPAPDLLLRAAQELGQSPAGCWCVGDSTWDMRAAVAATMAPIGITAGAAVTAADLTAAGGLLIRETLTELHRELRRTRVDSD